MGLIHSWDSGAEDSVLVDHAENDTNRERGDPDGFFPGSQTLPHSRSPLPEPRDPRRERYRETRIMTRPGGRAQAEE